MSRVLIENGADLENRNVDGKTPLHTFFNKVVEQVFLYHGDGINVELADNQGMTLLHFVAWSSKSGLKCFKHCMTQTVGMTSVLLRDSENRSVLHFAAQRGNAPVLQYILGLTSQAVVTFTDKSGRSLLHYAVENKRTAVMDIIHAHGGDVHAQDHRGRTVLHHAAQRGNLKAVEKLVELGAVVDVHLKDKEGKSPALLASQRGFTTLARYLEEQQRKIAQKHNTEVKTMPLGISIHEQLGQRRLLSLQGFHVAKQKPSVAFLKITFMAFVVTLLWLCVHTSRASNHRL